MISPHDDAMLELAALRSLGALDAPEIAEIDAHLATCAVCREEYAAARAAVTAVALSAAEAPPRSLRARVLGHAVTVRRLSARRLPVARFVAMAAAIAIVIAAGVTWRHAQQTGPLPTWPIVCLGSAAGCNASGRIVAISDDRLRLSAHGLRPLPVGKVYQVWVIKPGKKPIPEPTFSGDEQGNGSVSIPISAQHGIVVAVTVEPTGGSLSPTTKPLFGAQL